MPTQRALTSLLLAAATAATAQSQAAHPARPIEAATLPLPEHLRAGATIVREADDGTAAELRKGTNAMVCVDATKTDTFIAYCFTRQLFAVYQRAAQLAAQLHSSDMGMDVADAIEKEIKAGKLKLPRETNVGFAMMGPMRGYNAARNTVSAEVRRWQTISVPFATGASLGLPEKPSDDMPWLMHPGMWMAHIMIEHGAARMK